MPPIELGPLEIRADNAAARTYKDTDSVPVETGEVVAYSGSPRIFLRPEGFLPGTYLEVDRPEVASQLVSDEALVFDAIRQTRRHGKAVGEGLQPLKKLRQN